MSSKSKRLRELINRKDKVLVGTASANGRARAHHGESRL